MHELRSSYFTAACNLRIWKADLKTLTLALLVILSTLSAQLAYAASPPVIATVEEPITVEGVVVRGKMASFKAVLNLQVPIKISNDGDFHDKKIYSEIGIDLGDPARFPLPAIGTKGKFEVVVRCARFDCLIVEFSPFNQATQAAPQKNVPAQRPAALQAAPAAAFNSPIPIDFSAVMAVISFEKCQYMVNKANGRVNRNGMQCIVQNTSGATIGSRSVTYSKFDAQGVRMGAPYTLDTDLFPGEKTQIQLLGTEDAVRVVFRRETK